MFKRLVVLVLAVIAGIVVYNPARAAPSAAGLIAFMSNRDGNWEIYVMNADGSDPRNLTNTSANDWAAAWSPDGSQIAFGSDRDGNSEIYVMNADGSDPRNLTNTSANDGSAAWSPDGSQIAFESSRDGNLEIYVMNADGSDPRNKTGTSASDDYPAWQPAPKAAVCPMGEPGVFSLNRESA